MNNTIGFGYGTDGFKTIINNNDIKTSLNKTRLRDSTVDKVKEEFTSLGYEVKNVENGISVYAPPLLQEKEVYTLVELKEINKIKNEIEDNLLQQLNA